MGKSTDLSGSPHPSSFHSLPQEVRRKVWRTSLRVALVYAIFGICWIFFTDRLLEALISDPKNLATGQMLKGWTYVALTAVLAFFLWFRLQSRIEQGNTALRLGQFALDNAAISIFQIDDNGDIAYANQHASEQLGYSREELGQLHVSKIDPLVHPSWFEEQRRQAKLEGSRRIRTEHVTKDGRRIPVEVQVTYFSFEGTTTSFSFVTDMTARQEWERGIVAAKEAAESADRAKSDFLAMMSHEMRTPLNPIIGFGELLFEEAGDRPGDREALKVIIQAGERLLRLVDHALHFSKLDRHAIAPVLLPTRLHQLVEEAILDARGLVWHVPLRWTHQEAGYQDTPPDLWVRADTKLIRETLDHLIENAAKFTLRGEVVVSVSLGNITHRSPQRIVRFAVRDTGIGIPPKRLREMFQPFTQVDTSSSRSHEGAGLGLAIVAKIVAVLGGKIGAESDPGKGSCFWFEIPLDLIPAPEKPTAMPPETSDSGLEGPTGGLVLVVDDRPDNVAVARTVLTRAGLETQSAANGEEAIKHLLRDPVDLILMDLSMPGIDGIETTRRIRNSGQPWANVPIIGLSAHPSSEVAHKCHLAGMQDYYEKPIRPATFLQTLRQHLGVKPK
jgi:PAS domain S-box-containing protein